MQQLIVNADDYGLDENINQGIIKCFSDGIVTSTTVLANGDAFESGLCDLKNNPNLGVGVHLTLVNGSPLSPLQDIASLVTEKGEFLADYNQFFLRFCKGQIELAEVKKEWSTQIELVKKQGLDITHLDSHQHLHIFPQIVDIVIELAQEFGINKIRLPGEKMFFLGGGFPSGKRLLARNLLSLVTSFSKTKLAKKNIISPKHFYGMLWGGNLQEDKLKNILENLPSGVSEIMSHPGLKNNTLEKRFLWGYHWEDEVKALTSPTIKELIEKRKIQLISYRELVNE